MLAVRAAAIVKVQHRPADGALFARQAARRVGREIAGAGLCLVRRTCEFVAAGLEEFELSAAPDYFEVAAAAIDEMVRQVGPSQIGEDGLMTSGVILRHLVLPGQLENTKCVIDYVSTHFPPKTVLFSLMSQYTPQSGATGALARRLNEREYRTAVQYMRDCGLTDGFCQELSSAKEEYTPVFDLQGV